ncbi:MAG: hypothetical protein LUI07_04660 [Lachnospiraceae bacterium]|nr:hypothetical protein [Lachnospiraceae bacterium]
MKEKNGKRKGRWAYLNDYEKDASGAYVYKGTEFAWKSPRKPALARIWLFSLAALGAQIGAGCIPGTGMNGRAWVLLPYAAALAASVSLVWGAYALMDGGDPLPDHIYRQSIEKLPGRGLLAAALSGLAILGELINLIRQGQFTGTVPSALLYLLFEAAALACGLLLRREIRALLWEAHSPVEDD